MKKLQWAILAIVWMAFAFAACSEDDDAPPYQPDATIASALKQMYPTAEDVVWAKRAQYDVAACQVNGRELEIWFDSEANWVMTEVMLKSIHDLLPSVYTTFINSDYHTWKVDEVAVFNYPQYATESLVEVEKGNQKIALYYSQDGNLLHEKDITYGGNVHWPE